MLCVVGDEFSPMIKKINSSVEILSDEDFEAIEVLESPCHIAWSPDSASLSIFCLNGLVWQFTSSLSYITKFEIGSTLSSSSNKYTGVYSSSSNLLIPGASYLRTVSNSGEITSTVISFQSPIISIFSGSSSYYISTIDELAIVELEEGKFSLMRTIPNKRSLFCIKEFNKKIIVSDFDGNLFMVEGPAASKEQSKIVKQEEAFFGEANQKKQEIQTNDCESFTTKNNNAELLIQEEEMEIEESIHQEISEKEESIHQEVSEKEESIHQEVSEKEESIHQEISDKEDSKQYESCDDNPEEYQHNEELDDLDNELDEDRQNIRSEKETAKKLESKDLEQKADPNKEDDIIDLKYLNQLTEECKEQKQDHIQRPLNIPPSPSHSSISHSEVRLARPPPAHFSGNPYSSSSSPLQPMLRELSQPPRSLRVDGVFYCCYTALSWVVSTPSPSSLSLSFADSSIPLKNINNDDGMHIADARYWGVLLARQGKTPSEDEYEDEQDDQLEEEGSTLAPKDFAKAKVRFVSLDERMWEWEEEGGDNVVDVALGSQVAAVGMSSGIVRLFNLEGEEFFVLGVAEEILGLAAYENLLAIVYHSGLPIRDCQTISMRIYDMVSMRVVSESRIPITPGSILERFDFSTNGIPIAKDTANTVWAYLSDNVWTQIYRSKTSFWMTGASSKEIYAVKLAYDESFPEPFVSPVAKPIPMRIQICSQRYSNLALDIMKRENEEFRAKNWSHMNGCHISDQHADPTRKDMPNLSKLKSLADERDKTKIDLIRIALQEKRDAEAVWISTQIESTNMFVTACKFAQRLGRNDIASKMRNESQKFGAFHFLGKREPITKGSEDKIAMELEKADMMAKKRANIQALEKAEFYGRYENQLGRNTESFASKLKNQHPTEPIAPAEEENNINSANSDNDPSMRRMNEISHKANKGIVGLIQEMKVTPKKKMKSDY